VTSGGAALAQLRSSPSAEGAQRVYMIKENASASERQAASAKQQAMLDSWYGIV